MKVTYITKACGVALTAMILAASCVKETGKETAKEDRNFANKTLIQVFNATVNAANTQLFVDNNQVSGTAMTYGTLFPSSTYAFAIDAGLHSFSIRSTAASTTQVPINFSENMLNGKNYTIFTYDTITAAKQITVPTNIVIPTDTSARVRFANFVYAPFTAPGVDIFSYLKGDNVVTNLKLTEVTDFMSFRSKIIDTFYFRPTGTTNTIFKLALNPGERRSYTVIYRGSEPRGVYPGTRTASAFTNY